MTSPEFSVFTAVLLITHDAFPPFTLQPISFVDSPLASALRSAADASVSTGVVLVAPWNVGIGISG